MQQWTERTVVDQQVQYPYRYQLKDTTSGEVVGTYDISPVVSDGDVEGTRVNAAWLQPIEHFLAAIADDLAAFGVSLEQLDSDISAAQSNLAGQIAASEGRINTSITGANTRMGNIETTLATKAPLANPTLTNPRANTVAITANNTALATTAAVKTYLDNLMASYKG